MVFSGKKLLAKVKLYNSNPILIGHSPAVYIDDQVTGLLSLKNLSDTFDLVYQR